MIEVGKTYTLSMLELTDGGYGKGSTSVTVTGRDGNLLQINGSEIINLTSPLFHSLTDEVAKTAYYTALEEEFLQSLAADADT